MKEKETSMIRMELKGKEDESQMMKLREEKSNLVKVNKELQTKLDESRAENENLIESLACG